MTWLPSGPDFTPRGTVDPPAGWLDLVGRRPNLDSRGVEPATVGMTAAKAMRLSQVQVGVNRRVKYVRDHGDDWRVADTEGDCEDFALAKMVRLVEYGWPRGALLMTLLLFWDAANRKWTWHAVLCIATDHGPWILDNRFQYPRIAAHCVGYFWSTREKPGDARWERIRLQKTGIRDQGSGDE